MESRLSALAHLIAIRATADASGAWPVTKQGTVDAAICSLCHVLSPDTIYSLILSVRPTHCPDTLNHVQVLHCDAHCIAGFITQIALNHNKKIVIFYCDLYCSTVCRSDQRGGQISETM